LGVFIRGANWNNGSNAGAFTLNLNWNTGNTNNNVGFRCARYSSIRIYIMLGPNGISTDSYFACGRSAALGQILHFCWSRRQVCAKTATALLPSLLGLSARSKGKYNS